MLLLHRFCITMQYPTKLLQNHLHTYLHFSNLLQLHDIPPLLSTSPFPDFTRLFSFPISII